MPSTCICGILHYETDQQQQTVDDLNEAHRIRPNHAGTLIWRAAALARMEDWASVIESLQTAIAIRPSAAEQYKTLGVPIAGKAVEYFTRQLHRNPLNGDALRNRGLAYYFLGSMDAAIDDFSASLKLEEDSLAKTRRGQAFFAQGKYPESITDFGNVIHETDTDSPLHDCAMFWRGKALAAAGQAQAALNDIRTAIDLSPNRPAYHVLLGSLLRRLGDTELAIDALTQAIAIDFNDHVPFSLRGRLYFKQQQYLKAIVDFCRSLDLYPNQPEVIAWRGEAYLKNGQSQPALEDFELALTHDPSLVRSYCGRAHVLAERDQHEQATIWLTKAIHRFKYPKQWAPLLLARGKVFYQMSRFLPAIADFTAVIDIKRQEPRARHAAQYARALALVQQGQLTAAQRELELVVQEDDQFPGAKAALTWLANGQGPRPPQLHPPQKMIRPKRPPVVLAPIPIPVEDARWHCVPPHDGWIVRLRDKKRTEYGPVYKKLLDLWVSEGRIAPETKILRADWEKWKRAVEIYPQLTGGPRLSETSGVISSPHIVI